MWEKNGFQLWVVGVKLHGLLLRLQIRNKQEPVQNRIKFITIRYNYWLYNNISEAVTVNPTIIHYIILQCNCSLVCLIQTNEILISLCHTINDGFPQISISLNPFFYI